MRKNKLLRKTKEAKDLYTEHYRTLLNELEDYTNKWKDILSSWTGRFNVKMTM
jgi:ABC-type Zn uptake system ZnuABC Zn-binding protein ZnuA